MRAFLGSYVPVAMMSLHIKFDNNDHASSKMQFLHITLFTYEPVLIGPVHKYKKGLVSGGGLSQPSKVIS